MANPDTGIDEARAKLADAIQRNAAFVRADGACPMVHPLAEIDDLIAAVRSEARAHTDPPVPTEENLIPLVKTACALPTLEDALAYAAVWENDRAVKQSRESRRWETCFRITFHAILTEWAKTHLADPPKENG